MITREFINVYPFTPTNVLASNSTPIVWRWNSLQPDMIKVFPEKTEKSTKSTSFVTGIVTGSETSVFASNNSSNDKIKEIVVKVLNGEPKDAIVTGGLEGFFRRIKNDVIDISVRAKTSDGKIDIPDNYDFTIEPKEPGILKIEAVTGFKRKKKIICIKEGRTEILWSYLGETKRFTVQVLELPEDTGYLTNPDT
jgi:hypothetical protein